MTNEIHVNGSRLEARLGQLAVIGATGDGGVDRVAYSEGDILARDKIRGWMEEAGLDVRTDFAGNIIGRREGRDPALPPIVLGSHVDTVPEGGRFDGALGVLSALECAQVFEDNGFLTRHPIEVIVFTDEEGGMIGSRALAGEITSETLKMNTHSGKTVEEGLCSVNGNPERIGEAARTKGSIKAFLEIHIEQGSVLDTQDIDIGVVEGIVAIRWWDVTVLGAANHAGTTPMNMRRDAMVAAAHFILAVNRIVCSESGSHVGTVGRIEAEPGAPNVIPGKVRLSLELRDLSLDKIHSLYTRITAEASGIARETGTEFSFEPIDAFAEPAMTAPWIRDSIEAAAKELGLSVIRMPSGAGHDAQEIAKIGPIGMIFVPSRGGISHSPKEFTGSEDVINGAKVMLSTLLKIDGSESR